MLGGVNCAVGWVSSPKRAPFGGREHRCGVCFIKLKTDIECIQGYTRYATTSPLGPERLEVFAKFQLSLDIKSAHARTAFRSITVRETNMGCSRRARLQIWLLSTCDCQRTVQTQVSAHERTRHCHAHARVAYSGHVSVPEYSTRE